MEFWETWPGKLLGMIAGVALVWAAYSFYEVRIILWTLFGIWFVAALYSCRR